MDSNEQTIYSFTVYDMSKDKYVLAPRKATREAIELARGNVLEGSAENVDPLQLDGNGFLFSDRSQQ